MTVGQIAYHDAVLPRRGWRVASLVLVGVLSASRGLHAQDRTLLRASRATTPPKIDGVLDDAAWLGEPLTLGEWRSYDPIRGDAGPERTDVRVAYDDRYIYFAFHCLTNEPAAVRTTFSKRDDAFNDDWVGFSLDSVGSGQSSYHLIVNPSGVQMDAINTTASGEKWESDFVWYSAGSRTSDGYVVEIALPLESIRFPSAPAVTMGVLFWRHVSRAGVSYSWPEMPSGEWVFDRNARIVFDGLVPRRLVELLPSATLPLSQTRVTPADWNGVSGHPELGISAKYGITSQITVDATVNPDFSQVESDAFQVQVNQRFPTFFSEKRPFFMEGLGLFSVAGTGGDFNMRSAVHTRRIVNPSWGAKVVGATDRVSFGVLTASDESPEGVDRSASGHPAKLFTVGRATYGLGQSSYVGALVTDTEVDGRRNQVAGGDLSWKPSASQTVTAMSLFSRTTDTASDTSGGASVASYRYDTRRLLVAPQLEHYDEGFREDTGFYNRTGFTAGFVYSEINFYPEAAKAKRIGLIRVHPLVVARLAQDDVQHGRETVLVVGSAFNFNRQGFFRIQRSDGHEPWLGRRFRSANPIGMFGDVQILRWLRVGGNFWPSAYSTYYDPVAPFQGRSTSGGIEVTWQPTVHFNQTFSYDGVRFSRADTGARVYSVDVINAKSIYQFDTHFLVRLLEQFDSSRHQLLTDLLASYEVVPGTVFHAGYGSLYEPREFQDGRLVPDAGRYMTVSRGLFFKASYLYRF